MTTASTQFFHSLATVSYSMGANSGPVQDLELLCLNFSRVMSLLLIPSRRLSDILNTQFSKTARKFIVLDTIYNDIACALLLHLLTELVHMCVSLQNLGLHKIWVCTFTKSSCTVIGLPTIHTHCYYN